LGHTSAKVKLYSPNLSKSEEVELLVDTGSTYSWIPKGILERLNIGPTGSWKFKTVDGRTLERKIGEALMECMGEKATRMVVFAEDGDATILGVDALEGLRLEIDPITRRLKKAEALLAL
jgi:clan AA aspartic protease